MRDRVHCQGAFGKAFGKCHPSSMRLAMARNGDSGGHGEGEAADGPSPKGTLFATRLSFFSLRNLLQGMGREEQKCRDTESHPI
jgi:hypothetical protein